MCVSNFHLPLGAFVLKIGRKESKEKERRKSTSKEFKRGREQALAVAAKNLKGEI